MGLVAITGLWPASAWSKDEACAGISDKCTTEVTYDKTIEGTVYSCYDCKQALCKDGGKGGLSGTKTSSVCTPKATTFQPIQINDRMPGNNRLAPEPKTSPRRGKEQGVRSAAKDSKATPEAEELDHRKRRLPGRQPPSPNAGPDNCDGGDDADAGATKGGPGCIDTMPFDESDALLGTRTGVKPAQRTAGSAAPAPERKSKSPLRPVPTSPGPIPIPYPGAASDVR